MLQYTAPQHTPARRFPPRLARAAAAIMIAAAVLAAAAVTRPPSARDAAAARATETPAPSLSAAETYAVWVFLDEVAAASALPPAVSAATLARRPAVDTDRPIEPALLRRIAATGATVRYPSRWLRAVSVNADAVALGRLRAMREVIGIRPLRVLRAAAADAAASAAADAAGALSRSAAGAGGRSSRAAQAQLNPDFYGVTWDALLELNIPVIHDLGFTGTASRIAILDSGFSLGHESLSSLRIGDQWDFLNDDANVDLQPGEGEPNQERHGTFVFSLLGGYAPGRLVGGAYNATYFLAKIDVAAHDTRGDEDRWVQGVEWADSVGARIINSSIGFRSDFIDRPSIPYGDLDGNTTITTRMADEAARRNLLVVQAIGNLGPSGGSLWAPADADSILVVGAIDSVTAGGAAIPTPSSSRGPTPDGRIKPDVVARGAGLIAAAEHTVNQYTGGLTGSSFATPFITAGAALFWEAWPSLTAAAVRDALRLAGHQWYQPNNVTGYGVPDVAAAIMFPQGILLSPGSLAPTNQQGVLTSIAPTFSWTAPLIHPLLRPILYRVEVASDSLFTNIVFADTVREAFSYTARTPLRPIARAWWRVVAESPQGVRRTTAPRPSFTMPSWVTLLTLNEDEAEFISELRPELSWAPRAAPEPLGPFTYTVQVLSPAGAVLQNVPNLTTTSVVVPEALTPNQSYRWRVIARTQPVGGVVAADTTESAVPFVVVSEGAPPATVLYPNFPNPFPRGFGSHTTRIWLDLAQDAPVELAVYDLRGRLVRRLIPAQDDCGTTTLPAGIYGRAGGLPNGSVRPECVLLEWDATDHRGERVPRGVYLLRLRAGGVVDVRRMLYMPPAG